MVIDGNKGNSANDYFLKPGNIEQYQNSFQTPTVEGEKSFMEMEGRGLSDLYRNSSEELFLRSYMESSVAMPGPNMDTLGFKNLSQNFRTDSEELFKSWLTNGEASSCFFPC